MVIACEPCGDHWVSVAACSRVRLWARAKQTQNVTIISTQPIHSALDWRLVICFSIASSRASPFACPRKTSCSIFVTPPSAAAVAAPAGASAEPYVDGWLMADPEQVDAALQISENRFMQILRALN